MRPNISEAVLAAIRADQSAACRRLVARLQSVRREAENRFVSDPASAVFDRIYGGQILAEAFMAASQTNARHRQLSSVHACFLRLGNPACPTVYEVENLRDTASFAIRQVRAEQHGKPILTAIFSFTTPTAGIAHQAAMPPSPAPETLSPRDAVLLARYEDALPANAGVPWPIDIRYVDRAPWEPKQNEIPARLWMRAGENLPDDAVLHTALLLHASDLPMADAVMARHSIPWEDLISGSRIFGASLDHAVWLHVPARMDDWLLLVQDSPRAAHGRGLARGHLYTRDGTLVASVAQEIYVKETKDGPA